MEGRWRWLLLLMAFGVTLLAPLPYASSWNDGSRLATVESLVDRHTWAIDHSIFVEVPTPSPYDPAIPVLRAGTYDRMFIGDHFYSDKTPVPALGMAAAYWMLHLGGLRASLRPNLFCWLMNFAFASVPWLVAVMAIFEMTRAVELPARSGTLLTLAFAVGTAALPYARQVNNHIQLLAVCCAVFALVPRAASLLSLTPIGFLAGLGYAIDSSAGPTFLALLLIYVGSRRGLRAGLVVLAASLPWLVLHHALNYWIGGSLRPANANPALFVYPGSPFTPQNLTGSWQHASVSDFWAYFLALFFSERGFLTCNPALLLTIAAVRSARLDSVGWFGAAVIFVTWLLVSTFSTDASSVCYCVRWFIPLLAPGFYLLARLLKERPEYIVDVGVLAAGGCVMALREWSHGPWYLELNQRWPFIAGTLVAWIALTVVRAFPREVCSERAGAAQRNSRDQCKNCRAWRSSGERPGEL